MWARVGELALHRVQGFAEKCYALAQRTMSRRKVRDSCNPRPAWTENSKMRSRDGFRFRIQSIIEADSILTSVVLSTQEPLKRGLQQIFLI